MTIQTTRANLSLFHEDGIFSISVNHFDKKTTMVMTIYGTVVNTRYIPSTYSLVKRHLPSTLRSKCFNEKNYPFNKEVRRTELGHLFEHLLLENLYILKTEKKRVDSVHNGLTEWNWKKDARGVFLIHIDIALADRNIFLSALKKTIPLFRKVMLSTPAGNSRPVN